MKTVITGNHTAAYGAQLARAEVIAAYPITPQTQVVEKLAEIVAKGQLQARFIKVESEHSAMAASLGAAAAGARTFTATSSQGLALMHEMLHWATGARLPVVMVNINRAMAPPWNIWTDQTDSLSQRDTGWMQFYCADNQEILDTIIQAYKVCEQVLLPAMVVLDAFVLSHTSEPVSIPEQKLVDEFLPPYQPEYKLDPQKPHAFGGLSGPDVYYKFRYKIQQAMDEALEKIKTVDAEYGRVFGRQYGLVERYCCDDAEFLLITSGTLAETAKEVIDNLRRQGVAIGLARVRVFRPFPRQEIRALAKGVKAIGVIDRNISFGAEGIFFSEIKAALYNSKDHPPVSGFIAGLGGKDVVLEDIEKMARAIMAKQIQEQCWIGD